MIDVNVITAMLQQVSEIATSQVQAIQTQQDSRDKELTSLRQQLVDFQAQSNEKTVIGRLTFCLMARNFTTKTCFDNNILAAYSAFTKSVVIFCCSNLFFMHLSFHGSLY